ncbi:MAG: inorganic diphosphatase [Alphaproteobacteria bacterium]|jgi:inorganic pyrophosphatase|nr:inorganic diphosphatase [Alphaproteobacteria bacterium]
MQVKLIPPGRNPPEEVNAFIEIPQGGMPIKYELDPLSGTLFVDRFLHTAMIYPANYGFIPNTLSEDGDPVDILVVTPTPVVPGAVIRARPVGVLLMTDEKGFDEKVLAVPVDRLNPFYANVRTYKDLPPLLIEQIAHFFKHYKDLEPGKEASVGDWADVDQAHERIMLAVNRGKWSKG